MSALPRKRIQIHNVATDDTVLDVREVRVDLPPGEPHTLMGHHEANPGETINALLHEGGAVIITRRNSHG